MQEAKRKELYGLAERGTFEIVCPEDIEKGAQRPNITRGRFVLSIKNVGTGKEKCMAQLVVQGHTDAEKDLLVHNSTKLQKKLNTITHCYSSHLWNATLDIRCIASLFAICSQTYARYIYIRPSKKLTLNSNQLLKLLRTLYGLSESGDYWHETFQTPA